MVYKAIQSFFSEKATAFLPGKSFFPEEDKYASQFDPWSSGNRPVAQPWFNISINVQIGYPAPAQQPQSVETSPRTHMPMRHENQYEEPLSPTYPTRRARGRQEAAVDKFLGRTYGNSTIEGHASAHFGDVYHQTHYHFSQTRTVQRRNSSPSETLSQSMAYEALTRSSKIDSRQSRPDQVGTSKEQGHDRYHSDGGRK